MQNANNNFESLYAQQGTVFRNIKNRITKRINLNSESVVIKLHNKMGIWEFIGTLIKIKIPVVGAEPEKLAIEKLQKLGVTVPKIIDFYKSGILFWQKSYIILEDLGDIVSLEDLVLSELNGNKIDAKVKKELIISVASIARKLHDGGLVHRDFYLCHFILNNKFNNVESDKLILIDLHRCNKSNDRKIIKDLGALLFSAENTLSKMDKLRFIKHYNGSDGSIDNHKFWNKVESRAEILFLRRNK